MLSREDNEEITRIGPGTPTGALMREYWIPAMASTELPHPDCDPVRVLLLGEQLIAFRDTSGRVGLISNLCPHRGASLFFGRNEENGIRCVYHGWKFDTLGQCIDMPNEPAESNFKNRIKATAYPTAERGGVIWAYMGPRELPPPLPDIEVNNLPEGEYTVSMAMRHCNWLQALEGDIDTVHAAFLHRGARGPEDMNEGSFNYYEVLNRAPHYVAIDTDYGTMYGGYRPASPGHLYWRIAQFLFPCYTHIPTGILGYEVRIRAWVPMDDTHTMVWGITSRSRRSVNPVQANQQPGGDRVLPNTTDWLGRFRTVQTEENDYLVDRDNQRNLVSFTGIPGGANPEDQAVTETMGTTLDRANEHLGTSDLMIITTRRRILDASRALAKGVTPPGVDDPEVYRVRSGGVILPENVDWLEGIKDLLPAYVDHPELDLSVSSGVAPAN